MTFYKNGEQHVSISDAMQEYAEVYYKEKSQEKSVDSNYRKDIHDLSLHETTITKFGICIMRVESGWIYDCWDFEKDCFKQGLFVPFRPK